MNEKFESIPQVIERLTGIRPPDGTWRRWVLTGLRGSSDVRIKLKVRKLGGRIFTTEEFVREFIAATSAPPNSYADQADLRTSTSANNLYDPDLGSTRSVSSATDFLDGELGDP